MANEVALAGSGPRLHMVVAITALVLIVASIAGALATAEPTSPPQAESLRAQAPQP